MLACFHAFGELDAVLVVLALQASFGRADADGRYAFLVAVQLLVVQGAVLGQSQNILQLFHQVDDLDVLAHNLGLEPVFLITGLALRVEFL